MSSALVEVDRAQSFVLSGCEYSFARLIFLAACIDYTGLKYIEHNFRTQNICVKLEPSVVVCEVRGLPLFPRHGALAFGSSEVVEDTEEVSI